MMNETKSIPVSALRLTVGEFELGDNGDGAKTAPFRMVARSGQPIDHWYWGRIVHDLSGVQHKSRIPIDYVHDDKEVIGYANHFDASSGDLEVSGALVPYKDSDRASEIVHKFKAGVPYEASINFGGDGIEIEAVDEGKATLVNGYQFTGPGVVVRQWPLRGVAICPYGADSNTSTEFATDKTISVRFVDMTTQEPEAVEVVQDEVLAAVEGEPEVAEAEETPEGQPESESVEAEEETAMLSSDKAEGLRFLERFGEQGAVWFVNGLTFDEARDKYEAQLLEQIEELRSRLSAVPQGEAEPASFSEAKPNRKKQPLVRIAGQQYD
jgi:hypothetical protein